MSQKDKYAETKRLLDFIELVESYTESYDDMCDCGAIDNSEGYHTKGCQTLNFRADQHYALTGERFEL